jgi:peptide deformylase
MARWPDPVLRRPASPVSQHYFGTDTLEIACQLLQSTARKEKAVGLAAEQCGVDARIIYLENALHPTGWGRKSLVLVNPRIVLRAPETEMKVWKERCLVLPPTFVATVLRDAWVEVCYQQPESGAWRVVRLEGEPARAFQHEFDHDRGILITDHVSLEDMESELMASIEARGHVDRMRQAYSRDIQSILFESK